MYNFKSHRVKAESLANPVRDILEEKLDRNTDEGREIMDCSYSGDYGEAVELMFRLCAGLQKIPVVRCGTIDDCYDAKHFGNGFQFGVKNLMRWKDQFDHLAALATGRIRGLRMLQQDIKFGELHEVGKNHYGDEGEEVDIEIADLRVLRATYRSWSKSCDYVALNPEEYADHLQPEDLAIVEAGFEDGSFSFR